MAVKIVGAELPNIPWEDKPKGYSGMMWRYSKKPYYPTKPASDVQ